MGLRAWPKGPASGPRRPSAVGLRARPQGPDGLRPPSLSTQPRGPDDLRPWASGPRRPSAVGLRARPKGPASGPRRPQGHITLRYGTLMGFFSIAFHEHIDIELRSNTKSNMKSSKTCVLLHFSSKLVQREKLINRHLTILHNLYFGQFFHIQLMLSCGVAKQTCNF